jgi:putative membrane-bound dehydrogenase-like protein
MKPILAAACILLVISQAEADEPLVDVGVAKRDITPDYPIRLSGYGNRRTESDGVAQRLWAKALAVGSDADGPAVLVTVDNCGVPDGLTEEIARRLKQRGGIARERFALAFSHTHTGPCLTGAIPYLFSTDIPEAHQEHIDRYTKELTDALEGVALEALAARRPGRLAWAQGKATFAANRRTSGGPVEHDLPLLRVTDPDGTLRAVLVSYACHCTTLGGDFNQICGDWAGYAQEHIEREHPDAVALVAIGCGADANPQPRTGLDLAERHGEEIAREVQRLLAGDFTPVSPKLTCRFQRVELPYQDLPTPDQWRERAAQGGPVGYHAAKMLERLERGEKLPTQLSYPVQVWAFGDDLAMVFLGGEVVVDYSLRLKDEYDGSRLWVNSYSNAAPCYVPSRRVLREGGYEAGGSDVYYGKTAPFTPAVEDLIVGTVHKLLPRAFYSDEKKAEFPLPKSPEESLASIRVAEGMQIELVAAEPLIVDPVAIDFGPDGKLWVVEMYDYPEGLDGDYQPGGRVKYLEDLDGDGKYEKATLFLDGLPFPTGVMAWRNGALICAAPDILYAEDTDGDGKADVRKPLYTAFDTSNYQTRVNGLTYGLDNWVHGSPGLLECTVRSNLTGETVRLGPRSFRIRPDTGEIEATSGQTQHGRVRDDWGNWFGNHNSALAYHYPLPDRYLRRSPYVTGPSPAIHIAQFPEWNRVYPISRTLQRFNDPEAANRVTSACSPEIYRDELLGKEFSGDAFVCEAVHNLVTRLKVESNGVTFTGRRAAGEDESEFLASTDNWSRFVQVRTGPDGALWVADMYRFVIEHPRWISAERLAQLDVRSGADRGRIYRIYPRGVQPRTIPRMDTMSDEELAAALDSPNGWQRDMSQRLLVERQAKDAVELLRKMVMTSGRATARLQALCTLDGLGGLDGKLLLAVMRDEHPGVRRHAARLSEPFLKTDSALRAAVFGLADDADAAVRLQVACSAGESPSVDAGPVLAQIALRDVADPYIVAAALSSADRESLGAMISAVLDGGVASGQRLELLDRLIDLAVPLGQTEGLAAVLQTVTKPREGRFTEWQLTTLARVLEALARHKETLRNLAESGGSRGAAAVGAADEVFRYAQKQATDTKLPVPQRVVAVALLGRETQRRKADVGLLRDLLAPQEPAEVQSAAVVALSRMPEVYTAEVLLGGWRSYTPALRSQVLQTLLERDAWVPVLLDRIEKKEVLPGDIVTAQRQRLTDHRDAEIRKRAAALLASNTNVDRSALVEEYLAVAQGGGDMKRGADLFADKCAACHKVGIVGQPVGADLAALTDKSPSVIVTAVMDPNRAVEPKYLSYTVVTTQGLVYTGMLAGESGASITLVDQEGKQHTILRSEIEELESTGKSVMPEGFEKDLAPKDLADVIAFLRATLGAAGTAGK